MRRWQGSVRRRSLARRTNPGADWRRCRRSFRGRRPPSLAKGRPPRDLRGGKRECRSTQPPCLGTANSCGGATYCAPLLRIYVKCKQNRHPNQPNPVELNPPNSKKYYILYFRMVLYAFSHSYIPWQPIVSDFSQRKTVFDDIVVGRWAVFSFHFYVCLHLCA